MKPITLREHEVRHLKATGEVLVVRAVKPQPNPSVHGMVFELHPFAPSAFKGTPAEGLKVAPEKRVWLGEDWCHNIIGVYGDCPLGKPGDRSWVRETWGLFQESTAFDTQYQADYDPEEYEESGVARWRSPVSMPRSASRFTVETVEVECKRVDSVSQMDCEALGLWKGRAAMAWYSFLEAFGKEAFDRNSWCWFALVKEVK